MAAKLTRRRFVKAGAGALVLLPTVTRNVLGANTTLNIAGVGAGGKGAVDVDLCSSQNIVALCDVDARNASGMFKRFEKTPKFKDFRVMLDKMDKQIDAVTVSTPDHTHAFAALFAMSMGKHVYCQKPLTHDVYEARLMTQTARKHKLVTQMGNQGHNHWGSRRLVELIRAGVLGNVTEAHVWTDRPIWPQGVDRPRAKPPVPATLDWDLWLSTAPYRPYNPAYVPFKWRGWWDFGTGALGDMGCHNMDLSFWSLALRDPVAVEATHSGVNNETAPKWSIITHHYGPRTNPATGKKLVACKFTWYDGGKKPDPKLVKRDSLPGNGSIIVGDKDTLYVPHYWGPGTFISGAKMSDYDKTVPVTLPRMPGSDKDGGIDRNHHLEWINAIKAGKPEQALSNFDYAGPMSEAVLLGNVAMRAGKKIEWDAKAMKVTNAPEANRYLRRQYRKGWELKRIV